MKAPTYLFILLILSSSISISNAQFWQSHELPTGPTSNGMIIVHDCDDDGDPDVIAVTIELRIMTNNLPGEWGLWESGIIPEVGTMYDGELHDMDNDSDVDLICYEGNISWLESLGGGEIGVHTIIEPDDGSQFYTMTAGDVEGDGDVDIVVTMEPDGGPYGLTTWTQQDESTWVSTQLSDKIHTGLSRMVDIDGDGFLDFVATSSWSEPDTLTGGLMVYFGTLGGWFDQHRLRWAYPICSEHKIVDFDGDGDLDIVTRHGRDWPFYYPAEITWWENIGNREFVGHTVFSSTRETEGGGVTIAVLDVDNDGDMDIATSFYVNNEEYGEYHIMVNQGDNETFVIEQITSGVSPYDVVAADIDGDGDTDLVNSEVRWFENPHIDTAVDDPSTPGSEAPGHPSEFALHAAYPNPFNAQTTVTISLPSPADLNVSVYNVMGQQVATLADGSFPAGVHPLTWNTSADGSSTLTSGLYFIHAAVRDTRLDVASRATSAVQKVVLVR